MVTPHRIAALIVGASVAALAAAFFAEYAAGLKLELKRKNTRKI